MSLILNLCRRQCYDTCEEFLRSLGKGESPDGNDTKNTKKKENNTDAGQKQKLTVQEEQDSTGIKKTKEKQERAPNQGQGMTGGDKKGIQNGCPETQGVNSRKRPRMETDQTGELTPPNQQCESEMRERSRTRQDMDVGEHDGELTSNPGEEVEQGADTSAETEEKELEEETEKPGGKEGEQTDVYDFAKLTEEDSAFVQLLISMGEDSGENRSADQNEQSTNRMMGRQ